MATYDDDNKRSVGEKRCFDLLATLLPAYGDVGTGARRGQEEQERNILMKGKRKIDDDDDDQCKNQEYTSSCSYSSSSSLVESKRRRVESNDEPIRARPIRQIKPPVRKGKRPVVKQKEPVRREPGVTPDWLVNLMGRYNGVESKLVIEKVITRTDLKPDQGRLLIPFRQITEMDFLKAGELMIVEKHHRGDSDKGLDVILLNGNNAEVGWDANLRIWDMRSSVNYALCSGWNQFVRENDLEANQTRRLWSFHSQDGTLFLAFNPLAPAQPVAHSMSLALVPFTHAASSSSSMDPFVCEEANRGILPEIPRRSRTPRVWIQDPPTSDSTNLYLEGGLDLNRSPPPEECDEMDSDLEAVQATDISSSQESLAETSLVSFTETTTLDLELRL